MRVLPVIQETTIHFTNQIQDGGMPSSILKKITLRHATKIYLGESELLVQK